jgi:hypothetical protein
MKNSTEQNETAGGSLGLINYLDENAEPSLYRNGKVLLRRDTDGSDSGMKGVDREKREMNISDGRNLSGDQHCTVATNGFELLTRPLEQEDLDFFDQQQVVGDYYQQCVEIVEEATGARAFAFDHNVRSAQGKRSRKRISGGQQVQGPAHIVHGDYTLTSAPQRLRDLAKPPGGNDTLRTVLAAGEALISDEMVERSLADGGRFAIINVWRNIAREPVATNPIALCDGQTANPEDLVVFELHYGDRIGENYFAKHADYHRWVYYPEMTRDEALLIKQWDSAGPLARSEGRLGDASDPDAPCTFSFHSAFDDSATPADAPDRWSIEVRCIVIYD